MRAIVLKGFGGVENFEEREVENPGISDQEVLVRIKAAAFNPIDYQIRQGDSESKLLRSPILGRELSGVVVETGRGVSGFQAGDRVSAYVGGAASNGTYAEMVSVPYELLAKNPDKLSFGTAAALPMVGMTALQCFKRLAIPKDKAVFIAGGAGGVGTILVGLLLGSGNRNIYTTAGNPDSIEHLAGLGLDRAKILPYREVNIVEVLGEGSFDYVIDIVGGDMSEVCAQLLSVYGTYADISFRLTGKAREILFDKAAWILQVANYAHLVSKGPDRLSYYGATLKELFDMVEAGQIKPHDITVVGHLGIETVQRAHLLMEQNLTKGKKLIMLMD